MHARGFQSLHAGRGLATVLVLLFHFETVVEVCHPDSLLCRIFEGGWSGVDYFFVLSGFLMMYVHRGDLGRPDQIVPYLRRRFERIYPIYWALCLVVLPLMLLSHIALEHGGKLNGPALTASLLLIPHRGARLLNLTWTLEYEVTFYCLFLLFLLSRRAGTAIFTLWAAAVVCFQLFGIRAEDAIGVPLIHPFPVAFLLNLHCIEFLLGIAIASVLEGGYTVRRPRLALLLSLVAWFGFMAMDAVKGISRHDLRFAIDMYALLTGSVVLFSVLAEAQHALRLPRWLNWLGDASFCIYLTHFLVFTVARMAIVREPRLQTLPTGVVFAVLVPVALAPGYLLHVFVERRIQRVLKRSSVRPKGRAALTMAA